MDYGNPRINLIFQVRKLDSSEVKEGVRFNEGETRYKFHVTDRKFILPGEVGGLPIFSGILSPKTYEVKGIKIDEKEGEWWVFGAFEPLDYPFLRDGGGKIDLASFMIYLIPNGEALSIRRNPYQYWIEAIPSKAIKRHPRLGELETLLR